MIKFNLDADVETLELAGERLRSNPDILESLASDPRAVLAELGLSADADTANALGIYAGISRSNANVQASAVHIDV